MGKRKERRLAALSNAGRRVKLDLFAEPSGELGGSNVHGDAGGDTDSQHRDGLPNSPSSSGQQPQNPLLLLGQYSDDEVDEGSSKGPNDAKVQSPMLDEEAKGSLDEGSKDSDTSVPVDLVSQNNGQHDIMQDLTSLDAEGNEKNECDVAAGNLQNEMVSKDQMSASESFNEQAVTDINLGWKMVMHEESQRYYYWNVETGETSWEVPQVLVQATQLSNDLIPPASVVDKADSAAVGIDNSSLPSAVMQDTSAATQDTSAAFTSDGSVETTVTSYKELYGHLSQMNGCSGEHSNENQGCDINGKGSIQNNGIMSLSHAVDHPFVSNFSVEEQQSQVDFPSLLVKQSESLLERIKSLKKLKSNSQAQDTLSKYQLEIEIRLSDIRSLASYGSPLLPFWVHSDKQIKLIEGAVNDDLFRTAKSAHDEVDNKHVPASKGLAEQPNGMGHDSEVDHNENKEGVLTSEVSTESQVDASAVVLKDIHDEIPSTAHHVPLSNSPGSETAVEINTQVEVTTNPDQSTLKHGHNVEDDVDMDVDMEVEDTGNATGVDVLVPKDFAQTEQLVQLADYPSLLPEDQFVVPPPPDDEWIPPPPPDNEPVPPPPPPNNEHVPPPLGDPLILSYHALPSYTETGQPFSYAQYGLSYPGTGSEYYGQAASEVPTSNIYGQIAMPPGQLYYSAVPHMYNENPQVVVNPTDPVTYYELQDGAGSKSIPVNNFNDSGIGGEDRTSCDVPSTSSSIGEHAAVSVDDNVSLPPATAEAVAGSAASSVVAAKAQTKVARKKRAVAVGSSLKSNKKVSSLVDKWKAAKEELLEEEEEPESVFEALERKRQREIEEWHAKQIASGEAKDNANFQPLGGDWKERVKRKRAKAAKESVDTPQDSVEHSQQQPDLTELSKGLPSSWQAFWDEISKQVYYGNTITSETTWTRPTK